MLRSIDIIEMIHYSYTIFLHISCSALLIISTSKHLSLSGHSRHDLWLFSNLRYLALLAIFLHIENEWGCLQHALKNLPWAFKLLFWFTSLSWFHFPSTCISPLILAFFVLFCFQLCFCSFQLLYYITKLCLYQLLSNFCHFLQTKLLFGYFQLIYHLSTKFTILQYFLLLTVYTVFPLLCAGFSFLRYSCFF